MEHQLPSNPPLPGAKRQRTEEKDGTQTGEAQGPAAASDAVRRLPPAWASAVASCVLDKYSSLPPKGKPQPNEYTVLAGFVAVAPPPGPLPTPDDPSVMSGNPESMSDSVAWPWSDTPAGRTLECVALGTGTKCLGGSKRCPEGGCLHDCHAEVIARRGLIKWLAAEVLAAAALHQSLFLEPSSSSLGAASDTLSDTMYRLRPGTLLLLYVSQPPCGDSSIIELQPGQDCAQEDSAAPLTDGRTSLAARAGRTGAKPLPAGPAAAAGGPGVGLQAVPLASDVEAGPQVLGVLRRKPGKGDPTFSMSCSDKISRWLHLGLQGSLLRRFIVQPVRLSGLVVGALSTPTQSQATASSAVGRGNLLPGLERALWRAFATRFQGNGSSQPASGAVAEGGDLDAAAARRGASGAGRTPFQLVPPWIAAIEAPDPSAGLCPIEGQRSIGSGASLAWTATCEPLRRLQLAGTAGPGTEEQAALRQRAVGAIAAHWGTLEKKGSTTVIQATTGRKLGAGKSDTGPKTRPDLCRRCQLDRILGLEAVLRPRPPPNETGTASGVRTDAKETATSEASLRVVSEPAAPRAPPSVGFVSVGYFDLKRRWGRGYQDSWESLRGRGGCLEGWIPKPEAEGDMQVELGG